MHCESLYNLNFESDLVTGFPLNSSGFTESWGIEHVARPSPFDAELNNILLYPSLAAEQSKSKRKSKSVVERKEENVARKKTRVLEMKTTAALKSHSEAERRRRERINAHLETLRDLVPSKEKIDKATLLAEVINHVMQLRTTAEQSAQGLHIPTDTDDVRVEILENNDNGNPFSLRASLCCDQSPELLPGLRKAIKDIDIPARVLKCEVSTLEGRMKIVFLITCGIKGEGDRDVVANSVRASLRGVLDKVSEAAEYAQPMPFPRKRHRGSCLGAAS